MINCRSFSLDPDILMENRLPQIFHEDNVATFLEDNCVTLRGKLLSSTFLTVFEKQNCLTKTKKIKLYYS